MYTEKVYGIDYVNVCVCVCVGGGGVWYDYRPNLCSVGVQTRVDILSQISRFSILAEPFMKAEKLQNKLFKKYL